MFVSREEIEAKRTSNGGYTKAQLAEWGIPWPPPKGWKKHLQKSALPHPLKCSLCDYVAKNKDDFNIHWLDHD